MKYLLYDIDKKKVRQYNYEDVLDELYMLKARLPTDKELSNFKVTCDEMRKAVSKIDNKVPLYDIINENMYLVDNVDVYTRVIYDQYRFPDKKLFNELIQKKKDLDTVISSGTHKLEMLDLILKKRVAHKIDLMIQFLNYFDLDILENTYIRVYYLYTEQVGKNLTQCTRPSYMKFFQHITPYYTRNEIINLAKNMDIILPNKNEQYDSEKILELCAKIKANDITANTLLQHQEYMIEQNKVGLIQYYTLHGSYRMNNYLRNQELYDTQNPYLESIIEPMWNLINNAPAFDKDYILYRFIQNDVNLRHLKEGDIHFDNGFTSTTRDPFYRSDLYRFGFILVKIRIPAKKPGVGLCVETLSHFPYEQEIILGPRCRLKLEKKDNKCIYYHIDEKFSLEIKTRYEFSYVDNGPISFDNKDPLLQKTEVIDFLEIKNVYTFSLEEKIRFFLNHYVNSMNICELKIGSNVFNVFTEYYDSTTVYEPYYAIKTKNGFSLYCFFHNYIIFFIELGEDYNQRLMHVNFYSRYTTLERTNLISNEDFITFLAKLAYYFEIPNVTLHADYKSCDIDLVKNLIPIKTQREFNMERFHIERIHTKSKIPIQRREIATPVLIQKYGGIYCTDFYQYLKYKTKKYQHNKFLNIEVIPAFKYYQLDKLKNADPLIILKKHEMKENEEIYQIYSKVYHGKPNLKDFYLWLVDNRCFLVEKLLEKMHRFFKTANPFTSPYYILDSNTFLYNRGLIKTYPEYVKSSTRDFRRSVLNARKNEYRLS